MEGLGATSNSSGEPPRQCSETQQSAADQHIHYPTPHITANALFGHSHSQHVRSEEMQTPPAHFELLSVIECLYRHQFDYVYTRMAFGCVCACANDENKSEITFREYQYWIIGRVGAVLFQSAVQK